MYVTDLPIFHSLSSGHCLPQKMDGCFSILLTKSVVKGSQTTLTRFFDHIIYPRLKFVKEFLYCTHSNTAYLVTVFLRRVSSLK
jgi:hypothetical protein